MNGSVRHCRGSASLGRSIWKPGGLGARPRTLWPSSFLLTCSVASSGKAQGLTIWLVWEISSMTIRGSATGVE